MRELAKVADVILVVGAANSSNSNRLREIGIEEGVPSYLINDGSELKPEWVQGKEVVGLTAGASRPRRTGAACDRGAGPRSKTSKWNRWTARRNISSSAFPPS